MVGTVCVTFSVIVDCPSKLVVATAFLTVSVKVVTTVDVSVTALILKVQLDEVAVSI